MSDTDSKQGGAVRAGEHPYLVAGLALATAGAIAVAPIAPVPAEAPAVRTATQLLADGDSILNVPLNLFYDYVNIPYYELEALNFAARSLFFSGPWFAVSPTNLWGVDPGDPSHFQTTVNFLLPNPNLSGMEAPETDFNAGVGQQLWGMMAAVLPTSSGCDVDTCTPIVPESPITGVTLTDFFLWLAKILTGQVKFPLFDSWFKVSFDQLFKGFYFDPSLDASTDPSGPAYTLGPDPLFGLPEIPGTKEVTYDGVTYTTAMPWSGDTYTLNPLVPFQNFFNSLLAPPPTDGLFGTGILFPTFEQIGRTLQSFLASLAFFDPITPGSPFCPGDCSIIVNAHLDYPDIIKAIGNLWPGNTLIDNWVAGFDGVPGAEPVNVPTEEMIQTAVKLLQQGFFDFGNTRVPEGWNLGGVDLDALAPFFHKVWTSLGFNVPPLTDEHFPSDLGGIPITGGAEAPDTPDLSAAFVDLFDPAGSADVSSAGDWSDLFSWL